MDAEISIATDGQEAGGSKDFKQDFNRNKIAVNPSGLEVLDVKGKEEEIVEEKEIEDNEVIEDDTEVQIDENEVDDLLVRLNSQQLEIASLLSNVSDDDVVSQNKLMKKLTLIQSTIIKFQAERLEIQGNMLQEAFQQREDGRIDSIDILPTDITDELTKGLYSTLNNIVSSPLIMETKKSKLSSNEVNDKKEEIEIGERVIKSEPKSSYLDLNEKIINSTTNTKVKKRNYNVAKALRILSDSRLISPKAAKVLGIQLTEEEERTLCRMDSMENLLHTIDILNNANSIEEENEEEVAVKVAVSSKRMSFDAKRESFDENGVEMIEIEKVAVAPVTIVKQYKANEYLEIPTKAAKVLGDYEISISTKKRMENEEEIPLDVERLKIYTLPDKAFASPKLMQLTGETILAGKKVAKILGDPMSYQQVTNMKNAESKGERINPERVMRRKMRYTAPDSNKINSKVLLLLGEKMLASEKARKILGDDDEAADFAARKKALSVKDPIVRKNVSQDDQKKRSASMTQGRAGQKPGILFSTDHARRTQSITSTGEKGVSILKDLGNSPKFSKKAMELMGDTMLAPEKAQKILGSTENDELARKKALAVKDPEIDFDMKRRFTAPDPSTVNAKALALLGETMLASEKAQKILGSNEDDEKARAAAAADIEINIDYERKKLYTAPDAGTVNAKVMALLGETMLASEKAQKLLGSNERDEEARRLASLDKDPDVDYNRKRIFSAPEAGSTNSKAIQLLGESLLAAEKAQKVLGSNENDDIARRKASSEKPIEIDVNRMMRYTMPETHTKNLKVVELLGETLVAGSKAEKLLGHDGMSKKQMDEMHKSDIKEEKEREKVLEKEVNQILEASNMANIFEASKSVHTPINSKINLSPTSLKRRAGIHVGMSSHSPPLTPKIEAKSPSLASPRGMMKSPKPGLIKSESLRTLMKADVAFSSPFSPRSPKGSEVENCLRFWKHKKFSLLPLNNKVTFPAHRPPLVALDKDTERRFSIGENLYSTIWRDENKYDIYVTLPTESLLHRISEFDSHYTHQISLNSRLLIMDDDVSGFWLNHPADSIAISASDGLDGKAGVERMIHYYAGPSLSTELESFGNGLIRCIAGGCLISHGHNLKQKWILHCNDNFDDDEHLQPNFSDLIWKILHCIDGTHIRTINISLHDLKRHGNNSLLLVFATLVTIRHWLEINENRSMCEKIIISAPHDVAEVLHIFSKLVFPTE